MRIKHPLMFFIVAVIVGAAVTIAIYAIQHSGESSKATQSSYASRVGEHAYLDGLDSTPVAVDEQTFQQMTDALSVDDESRYRELLLTEKILLPKRHTRVKVLAIEWGMTRVRILEGPFEGRSGWTYREWVKPYR